MSCVRALCCACIAVAGLGCGTPTDHDLTWIVIETPRGVDLDDATVTPAVSGVRRVRLAPGRWSFGVPRVALSRGLVVDAAGACPATLDTDTEHVSLSPWVDVPSMPQVGWGSPFRIEVRPGCREATAGGIEWRHAGGVAPEDLATDRNGFVVSGRAARFEDTFDGEPPWGVVPLSPRTRGATVLEGTWTGAGRPEVKLRATIAAAPRATGLPSVPLGGRVDLGGNGWRIAERPRGASAELVEGFGRVALVPDSVGTWQLRDAEDRELLLRVGRYDDTPLDCGRSDCHAAEAAGVASSPMTSVFARALEGGLGDDYDPSCAIGCHTVGEPGLPDGGFAHVLDAGGFGLVQSPHEGAFRSLPVALQRLSGVGCVACHGPGAIPAPESRWAIVRSDVCATCHDAPARYGHVVAWRSSKMARSDEDPRTRDASCRGCHTTLGFLARIGVRDETAGSTGMMGAASEAGQGAAAEASGAGPGPGREVAPHEVQSQVGPIGIACAACHAPHGEHVGVALLRRVPLPPSVASAPERSVVCTACHAAPARQPDNALPAASAATLVLAAGAEHRAVEGGCVGCHRAGPEGGERLERGASHAFGVDAGACESCHADRPGAIDRASALSASLQSRARELLDALVARGVVRASPAANDTDPLHARAPQLPTVDHPLADAARNVTLVLEDPAAGAHAPSHARRLLTEAATQLGDGD